MWWVAAYFFFFFFCSEKNGGASGYEEFLTHLLLNKLQICLLDCTTLCYRILVAPAFGETLMEHLQHSREQAGPAVKQLYFAAGPNPY